MKEPREAVSWEWDKSGAQATAIAKIGRRVRRIACFNAAGPELDIVLGTIAVYQPVEGFFAPAAAEVPTKSSIRRKGESFFTFSVIL